MSIIEILSSNLALLRLATRLIRDVAVLDHLAISSSSGRRVIGTATRCAIRDDTARLPAPALQRERRGRRIPAPEARPGARAAGIAP
jgi:hypothetical protein